MRLPITLITAALAIAFAAGPAQAFTPPIGTDKGSATAATPTTPHGIIAILIG
jgi:hypothetical protein